MVHENSIRANQGKCHFLASLDILETQNLKGFLAQQFPENCTLRNILSTCVVSEA